MVACGMAREGKVGDSRNEREKNACTLATAVPGTYWPHAAFGEVFLNNTFDVGILA